VCLAEKEKNTNFIVFDIRSTRSGLKPTISRIWDEHTNHYSINQVTICWRVPLNCRHGSFQTHFMVWVLINVEDPTVTVKCRTAIKALFLYLNLCLSVMLNNLLFSLPLIFIGAIRRDRMVVVSSNPLRRGVLDTTLCDKVFLQVL
jgi:hypothetical protein